VILNGHEHVYERFAPQTPAAVADAARGIRQFTVGTGGRSHCTFGTIKANSQVRNGDTYGVLKLTLRRRLRLAVRPGGRLDVHRFGKRHLPLTERGALTGSRCR
jgi:hypothetical protein